MKVFLGGTVGKSKWRNYLIPRLEVDYFNPVVENWDETAQEKEIKERQTCDYVLYVLTPKMEGYYAIAEVTDDSYKRPDKTLFCFLTQDENDRFTKEQVHDFEKVRKKIIENGGNVFESLDAVIHFLNSANERKSIKSQSGKMNDVFISYGRRHSSHFARMLFENLKKNGKKAWFDMNDIPLAVDFQEQIDSGIEQADNFIYVISPHSVKSEYCLKELVLALKYHKRIIPILHVEPNDCWDLMHPEVGKRNWIYFRQKEDFSKDLSEWKFIDDFSTSFKGLLNLLESHKEYLRMHTLLLHNALEWNKKGRSTQNLLVGKDRQDAEKWILKKEFIDQTSGKEIQPPTTVAQVQAEYIEQSKKNANNLYTQAFISYSVKLKEKQRQITSALAQYAITTWVHDEDIAKGEDFVEAINRGVIQADNFIYLISEETSKSEYCDIELQTALKYNKRIIPLLLEKTHENNIHEAIKNLQYIDFSYIDDEEKADDASDLDMKNRIEKDVELRKEKTQFEKCIDELIIVINTEKEYYERHKLYLVQAKKWIEQNKNNSILLRGHALEKAKTWLQNSQIKQHKPVDLHHNFIKESEAKVGLLNSEVFISYSRKDSDFSRKLNENLQMSGKNTWFDQESIAAASDFQNEIYNGIRVSDNFLFIISPDSVKSQYCEEEVNYALKHNKRIITVLFTDTSLDIIPESLRKIQWIDFVNNSFNTAYNELVRTLDFDREYVRNHTKLALEAYKWVQGDKDKDFLLRGNEALIAEKWLIDAFGITDKTLQPYSNQELAELPSKKKPEPTNIQIEFVKASLQAIINEKKEEEKEKKKKQRSKNIIIASIVALIVVFMIVILIMVNNQRQKERNARKLLESRKVELEQKTRELEKLYNQLRDKTIVEAKLKYDKNIAEGNDFKQKRQYEKAIESYKKALDNIRGLGIDSSNVIQSIKICEDRMASSDDFEQLIAEGDALKASGNDKKLIQALKKYREAKATGFDDDLVQNKINQTIGIINSKFEVYKRKGLTAMKLQSSAGRQRAKTMFLKALVLKPNDKFVKQKLKELN